LSKRVLVTGASGFVGANLGRRLVAEGHDVHLVLRSQHSTWRLAGNEDAAVHQADLRDAASVGRAVRDIRPDWIFHLAAYGAYSSQTDVREMVETNLAGTINLVEACLESGFESFVNTGSSSEYGLKHGAPAETEPLEPNSPYAVTKAAATMYGGFAARKHGARIRTLRLYSVYGPWEEPTRLIPTLIVNGLHSRLPALVDSKVARDFVYVDDVCDAYLAAAADKAAAPDAIFNVGTGVQSSLERVVQVARRLLAIDAEPQWGSMPNRVWDTTTWVADSKKIRHELGWEPRHSLEAGLSATIDWFRAHPSLLARYGGAEPGPTEAPTTNSRGGPGA
jgi:nucleoside-diphosphate-sugar epimerase